MKIKQLIKELNKYDENLEVMTEGCDCNGDVGSVEYQEYNERIDGTGKQRKLVTLKRSEDR